MIRRRCRGFSRPSAIAASTAASITPSPRWRSSSPSRTRSGSHASAGTVPGSIRPRVTGATDLAAVHLPVGGQVKGPPGMSRYGGTHARAGTGSEHEPGTPPPALCQARSPGRPSRYPAAAARAYWPRSRRPSPQRRPPGQGNRPALPPRRVSRDHGTGCRQRPGRADRSYLHRPIPRVRPPGPDRWDCDLAFRPARHRTGLFRRDRPARRRRRRRPPVRGQCPHPRTPGNPARSRTAAGPVHRATVHASSAPGS